MSPGKNDTSIAYDDLFGASDPDGDTITRYRLYDGTVDNGRFTLNGAPQVERQNFEFDAADLPNLAFETSAMGSDVLWVQAYDGVDWGAWTILTVAARANIAPTVTVQNITPPKGTIAIAGADLFTVTDPDDASMVRYRFYDGTEGNGRFYLNGDPQVERSNIEITQAQLANLEYRTGSTAGDTLWIQAYDGFAWGAWKSFNVAAPANVAPVVNVQNLTPAHGVTAIAAANLFTLTDPDDANTALAYRFYDGTLGNGRFWLNGAAQIEQRNIEITQAQLAGLEYRTSPTGTGDMLWIQAFDGIAWSAWKSFTVAAPVNTAPVVNVQPLAPAHGVTRIAGDELYTSITDADGDPITRYRFYDGTLGNGRYYLSGTAQVEQRNIEITAAELADFEYRTSASGSDVLWVQVFDGTSWSAWKSYTVAAVPNAAPVVTVQNLVPTAGQTAIAGNALYTSITDADGDPITRYRFYDGTLGNGRFYLDGDPQVERQNFEFDAADLANLEYRTSTGGGDTLWVQAYDGYAWSDWKSFSVAARPNAAPVVDVQNINPRVSQTAIAAADLFEVADPDLDPITRYAFYDGTVGNGRFHLNGNPQVEGQSFEIAAADLVNLEYRTSVDGSDILWIKAYDGNAWSDWKSFTVGARPVTMNAAPVARPDSGFEVVWNRSTAITAESLLANDSDPDGDFLTITSVANPSGGAVALENGAIIFTPTTDYSGPAEFTYTVSDGRGSEASGTVTLTVRPNTAPTAAGDSATVRGSAIIDVLANDSDDDGHALSVIGFSQPTHGFVTLNPDGTFTYTRNAGFSGTDSFSYTISDGTDTDTATVSITVEPSAPASSFRQALTAAQENQWIQLNINKFSDVWTPVDLRPTSSYPDRIISAWSSMAWDSNRGDLIFWGGGHANSSGNEVYRWRSTTLSWERASLPSDVVQISGARYETVDGPENAPISAHTYDNNEFLPIADRFVVFGGAAWNTGGSFVGNDNRATGPYFWDPSKADADKVGGTTGSAAGGNPEIAGGQMWQNRNSLPAGRRPGDFTYGFTGGATAYAQENGKDVIYFSDGNLWKYTVNDVNDPGQDSYELVGTYFRGYSVVQGAGAIDPANNVFLRTTGDGKFTYWDLNQAGPGNANRIFVPTVVSGDFDFATLRNYGMDFDSKRGVYVLWNGDPEIWILTPPSTLSTDGWTLERRPVSMPDGAPHQTDALSNGTYFSGILGKWKYIAEHDIFLGVLDPVAGTIWAYKPEDWHPDNVLPSVAASGAPALAPGQTISAAALITWSDADGDSVRFQFIDQTTSADSGHFRLDGVDQDAGTVISVSAGELEAGRLLWVAGLSGSRDQIGVVASDAFGAASGISLASPDVTTQMAALLAVTPGSTGAPLAASVSSGTGALLASCQDEITLANASMS